MILDVRDWNWTEVPAIETFDVVRRCDPYRTGLHAITAKRPVTKCPSCRIANCWRGVSNPQAVNLHSANRRLHNIARSGNDYFQHRLAAIGTSIETCRSPVSPLDGDWSERSGRA